MTDIPRGYCQCGCGQKTKPYDRTDTKRGYVKGELARFVYRHHASTAYSIPEQLNAFWSKVAITANDDLCWEWTGAKNSDGYGNFWRNGVSIKSHQVAWMYPDYVILDGMEICHSCDNPACCNPKHLFLGSHLENLKDMEAKNRRAKGEKITVHKMTRETVIEARSKYENGNFTIAALAREYGVAHRTMTCVLRGLTWKD